MAKLVFDAPKDRQYENGVGHVVLYTLNASKWTGVA